MTTIERIDHLSNERSQLYRSADSSRRAARGLKQRVANITAELDQLWERRRVERIGHLDGIDLLVEESYVSTYGDTYRDTVSPTPVEEEQEAMALVA